MNMKTLQQFFIIVIVVSCFTACKKDKNDTGEPLKDPDIYALVEKEGPGQLYKNGERVRPSGLPDAFSIRDFDFVHDQLVIVGYGNDNDAKVWLNNEAVSLGLNFSTERLQDMAVYESSIYYLARTETGFKYVNASSGAPWKSVGKPADKNMNAKQITIVQGKVTVLGDLEWADASGKYHLKAFYWQEDKGFVIMNEVGNSQYAAVVTQGANIYVTGRLEDEVGYWEDKEKFNTVSALDVYGMAVSGTDVYICGYNAGERAAYWKNGSVNLLADYTSYAVSIAVHNNKVYIGGSKRLTEAPYEVSQCWIDGQLYTPLVGIEGYITKLVVR